MVIADNRVMEVNDLVSQLYNFDFDGDSMIIASLHSNQARKDFEYMFIKNQVEFESKDEPLIDYEHESIYAAYMLSYQAKKNETDEAEETTLEKLKDFSVDSFFTLYNAFNQGGIRFQIIELNKTMNLFEIMVNKILKLFDDYKAGLNKNLFYTIDNYGLFTKKNLNKFTWKYIEYLKSINKEKQFWDRIHKFNKFLLEGGTILDPNIASFDFEDFVVDSPEISKFKENLIQNEPFLAFHQNMILFEDYIVPEVEKKEYSILNTLFKSGARLKSVQLLKAASNSGIPTDIYGKAIPLNIKNALLDGLTPEQYFKMGDSARLALQQRQDSIPKGGELQRKFFFITGVLKQAKDIEDCHKLEGVTPKYLEIEVRSKKYLESLKYRWYLDEESNEEKVIQGNEEHLIGKVIKLRSPITCQAPDLKICKKCLGEKRPSTANLGAPVGQYLSEAIIQSVLRAHHFGGVFLANLDPQVMNALRNCEVISATEDETAIRGKSVDIETINEYLKKQYKPEDILIDIQDLENDQKLIQIKTLEMPYSEDATKILREIVSLIDKKRSKEEIDFQEIYEKLLEISNQNGILNIYFELVLSLLFYDEENVLYRYSDTGEIAYQSDLKSVINNIDPKLGIFYNFSKKTIKNIYTFKNKKAQKPDHMYNDLIEIYK